MTPQPDSGEKDNTAIERWTAFTAYGNKYLKIGERDFLCPDADDLVECFNSSVKLSKKELRDRLKWLEAIHGGTADECIAEFATPLRLELEQAREALGMIGLKLLPLKGETATDKVNSLVAIALRQKDEVEQLRKALEEKDQTLLRVKEYMIAWRADFNKCHNQHQMIELIDKTLVAASPRPEQAKEIICDENCPVCFSPFQVLADAIESEDVQP